MINIAICDDQFEYLHRINKLVKEKFDELNLEVETNIFSTSKDLLESVSNERYDIIFLDIEIDNNNGIDIAKILRNSDYNGIIIFITSYSKFFSDGYKVEAFRYILKQNIENELTECVHSLINKLGLIQISYKNITVNINEILFVESDNHKVIFHFINGKDIECWGKLDEVESSINSPDLMRIHKSYIINIQYFKEISRYEITLINDLKISVPRARYKEVKNKIAIRRGIWS